MLVKALIDFDRAPVFALPAVDGAAPLEGMLIEGPQGWGEFSPPPDCDDATTARWLTAAIEAGTVGWPDPVRGRVPVAVAVPTVDPARAYEIVTRAGCRTADVAVGSRRLGQDSFARDIARVEAVRDALGTQGTIRCDAAGAWDVDTAVGAINALEKAAGQLAFVAQPCRTDAEMAAVRRATGVPIAATPGAGPDAPSADLIVLAAGPLGGVRRALRMAEVCGLPCVVRAARTSSIGTAADLALAGALPGPPAACAVSVSNADLVTGARSLRPVDGYLPAAPTPPAPDPELLARYAITDRHRIAWWRERLRNALNT